MPCGVSKILASLPLAAALPAPGFDFLGYGYDAFYGNPLNTKVAKDPGFRTNLFTWTYDREQRTNDGEWDVADKTTCQSIHSCNYDVSEDIINSAYTYQRNINAHLNVDLNFYKAALSFGLDASHIRNTTTNDISIFGQSMLTCGAYDLTMHKWDPPALDENFVAAVKFMPLEYDEDFFGEFLSSFGTHYVYGVTLGGRWGWQMEFDHSKFQHLMDDNVDVSLGIKWGTLLNVGLNVSHRTNETFEVMQAISHNTTFNIGGEFSADKFEWERSVRNAPMPLDLRLGELHQLLSPRFFPDSDRSELAAKAKVLKEALAKYCSYLMKRTPGGPGCEIPPDTPMPRPKPVDPHAIHRVCMVNKGGFGLKFTMFDDETDVQMESSMFSAGQQRCFDGAEVSAKQGEKLRCRAFPVGARHGTDCPGSGYPFDRRSTLQSNYVCSGSVPRMTCTFRGLSRIGSPGDATPSEKPSEVAVLI